MLTFDHEIIKERGGNLCGDDRFSIEACAKCQGQYLYNNELKDIYYDPFDLSRRFFNIEGIPLPPCGYCGALNWEFVMTPLEYASARIGPWGWALQT